MNTLALSLRGFSFNGQHNKDIIGVVMHSKSIQSPPKKKIKDSVPFMNGSYDFSTVGSNGEITYSEREITIVLGLLADTKEQLQVLYSSVLEWLVDSSKQKLIFDVMPDYYFMAEVESTTTFEELMIFGKLEVKFVADPFKCSLDYIGVNKWDSFNFEEDRLQDNGHDVVGSKIITIYNPGRTIRPTINCSAPMTLIQNGVTYNLTMGDNKLFGFYLKSDNNQLTINGSGRISFTFRKESL